MSPKRRFPRIKFAAARTAGALVIAALVAATPSIASAAGEKPSGPEGTKNLALDAKVAVWPRPTYRHCTDPDDAVQLTDGKTTKGYFWTQKGTVGWQSASYATVTVDLGKVQPIAGVSFTTAAGVAGVTWPAAIHVLVSDDGKAYRDAGDLVPLDRKAHGPWPEGYAIRRLVTMELATRGRFVRFVIIPVAGGPYIFCDEVEVFQGPDELLRKEPTGTPVADVKHLFVRWRTRSSIQHRFDADAAGVERAVRDAKLPDETIRQRLLDRLAEVRKGLDAGEITVDESFRAVLPLSQGHARLFGVQAELWRALGRPPLSARAAVTWDPVDPFAVPEAGTSPPVEVHTMLGEHRAAAVNVANAADQPAGVQLRFEGLPGSPNPDCVTVHEVAWTDTGRGVAVAAALPEAARKDGGWSIRVLPGLVRQVWFTFHVTDLPPGEHAGAVVLTSGGGKPVRVPVRLHVYPVQFPKQTALWLGGWSYSNGRGSYGITPQNRKAFLEHLQEHFVNAPWAGSGVLMKYKFDAGDPGKIELDTKELDEWIATWPDARAYMVFLSVAHYSGGLKTSLGGVEIGTPQFDARVGTWISAWVKHLRGKGIGPDRLGLLIHDEPHEGSNIEALLAWARAIRAAEPEVLIWEDPTYRNPAGAPKELFEACDVLCPNRPMWLEHGKPFEDFYLDQRRRGKTLHSYSCSGPARLLDPYAYYRLQAWHCWRYGGTGSFFWAFGDNSGASSWNEYLARSGPYTPLFIDDTTITAGKQMEAVRESVEDYETLLMLRGAVERAKAAGRKDAAVEKAESLLATTAAQVLDADGVKKLNWHDPKDRTIADAVRVKVLEALVSLK